MRKLVKSRSEKRGLPPGTPVYVGDAEAGKVSVTVIDYDSDSFTERQVTAAECSQFRDTDTVTWINVDGIHDVDTVAGVAEQFGLHPLVQEDILYTGERPKMEDYRQYIYIVLKMLRWDAQGGEIAREQVSLILGRNFVISFQERPGDVFGPIRQRIRTAKGRVREMGADYLLCSLLDAIAEGYFQVLERLGDKIEAMESRLTGQDEPEALRDLHRLKREGLFFRKAVWPMREMIGNLQRAESELIGRQTDPYLRNIYDHMAHVLDTVETFRDMLSGVMDSYLTMVNNRMNEVMKVLTIIATIFIPLTFIAGVYGMNFKRMPELDKHWAYPGVLAVMLAVALGMILFFRKKKWL